MSKRRRIMKRLPETSVRAVTAITIFQEAEYIMERASAGDGRVVTLRQLLFFSTPSRDAWVLDQADAYALCLMYDGERQPNRIIETETKFLIDWPATYSFEGDLFTVAEETGRVKTYYGYPAEQIARAARTCR